MIAAAASSSWHTVPDLHGLGLDRGADRRTLRLRLIDDLGRPAVVRRLWSRRSPWLVVLVERSRCQALSTVLYPVTMPSNSPRPTVSPADPRRWRCNRRDWRCQWMPRFRASLVRWLPVRMLKATWVRRCLYPSILILHHDPVGIELGQWHCSQTTSTDAGCEWATDWSSY